MTCILCAARGRTTETDGHCCTNCRTRLDQSLGDILRLASQAAAYQPPTSSGSSRPTPGSRPPMSLDGLEPELTLVQLVPGDRSSAVPILDCLESWERAIREDRELLAFGPATAYRLTLIAKEGPVTTRAYLTGTVNFLRGHIGWITTEPTFGLEDFAGHVYASVRALRRFDRDNQPTGTVIACPTVSERGECGYRLRYDDLGDQVTCPRCKATRDAATLATIAMSDGRQVWLDPEAAAAHLGIDERTLRRRAMRGEIKRAHGRYLITATLTTRAASVTMI